MTSRDFCYWLQGFFELTLEDQEISIEQSTLIRQHLNLVFKHEIDPSMGDAKHQEELNKIHDVFPKTEEEAITKFGPKPGQDYELSYFHGWYKPSEGVPRC